MIQDRVNKDLIIERTHEIPSMGCMCIGAGPCMYCTSDPETRDYPIKVSQSMSQHSWDIMDKMVRRFG